MKGAPSSVTVENCDITGITGPGPKAGIYVSADNNSSLTVNNTNFHDMATTDALYFRKNLQRINGSGNSYSFVNSPAFIHADADLDGTITFDNPVFIVTD